MCARELVSSASDWLSRFVRQNSLIIAPACMGGCTSRISNISIRQHVFSAPEPPPFRRRSHRRHPPLLLPTCTHPSRPLVGAYDCTEPICQQLRTPSRIGTPSSLQLLRLVTACTCTVRTFADHHTSSAGQLPCLRRHSRAHPVAAATSPSAPSLRQVILCGCKS